MSEDMFIRILVKLFSYVGYPEVVFLLLNAGLDVKQKDSFGQV